MSKKRNIIEEIESKKIRSNFPSKYGYLERFGNITSLTENLISSTLTDENEILRYIPLATIAATETYFRFIYQEIIDKGEPYFSNAVKYFKEQGNIKFDLEFLIPLQGKQVTVGEIFSHLLQLNNLNDINGTLTKLLGFDFLNSLKKFPYTESMSMKTHSRRFKISFGNYIDSVNRMFEYRHILAHEYALNISLDKSNLISDFNNFKVFIDACDFAVAKTLGNYMPEYQQGMNKFSYLKYKKAQTELNKLIQQIKRNSSKSEYNQIGNKRLFNQSFNEWAKYRDTYSQSFADTFKGGSIYPLIYNSEMERLTVQLINNLKESFSFLLKQNSR